MFDKMVTAIKRVYCLYRVSTLGQVEKDDIPMQKQFSREVVQQQTGWEIVKEFSEKGVSGFKVSAEDRDAIQEIQRDALQNKFDVLLIFMFDRLGRREDETPFVVEWFVKNGIEVWSAKEGQQRFDTHVDKLLNYIRYWQASGESVTAQFRHRNVPTLQKSSTRFRGAWRNWNIKWKSSVLPDILKRSPYSGSLYHLSKCTESRTLHIVCTNYAKRLVSPAALFITISSAALAGAVVRKNRKS